MSHPSVVVEGVRKTFVHMGRRLEVLKGVDLTIEQGEVVAIVGKSGAGKSTLLHCIGTLDVPTSGRIWLAGDDLTGLSDARLASIRNRTIGFVFQFHHLLPEFSALENVMMPGLIQGRTHREMEGPARALLDEVGLRERATHRPGELSGGEQQRVALARALVLSPRMVLADEPTGNLDSNTGAEIQRLFFRMNERHGTTIIVVTHDGAFAASMPRTVTMHDGLIADDVRRERTRSQDIPDPPPSSAVSRPAPAEVELVAGNAVEAEPEVVAANEASSDDAGASSEASSH